MFRNATVLCTLTLSMALTANTVLGQDKGGSDDGGIAGAGIPELATYRVVSGLVLPLFVTAPPGDMNRMFVVEQRSGTTGRIRLVNQTTNPYTLQATIYLSVTGVSTGNEQGLLGLAFHPDFLTNGYFWVNYTNAAGTTIIARYRASAPFATSTSAVAAGTTILSIAQPFSNHNGGWIAFAPNDTEGHLYIGMGDGGSANDPSGNAQNNLVLLGKMLRIDIDGADNVPANDDDDGVLGNGSTGGYTNPASNPFFGATAGRDEIWAIGLRNPWRNAFDRANNDLFIADVGQNAIEEIDYQPGSSIGGENYGWRCMEGNNCTRLSGCTCNSPLLTDPIVTQTHGAGNCSITGGYVYRGAAIPALQGTYFFADYCSNQIRTFPAGPAVNPPLVLRTTELAPGGGLSIASITSFGEDAAGELYIVDQGGEVFKVVAEPPGNICNNAVDVSDGNHPFATHGATTDGVDPGAGCAFVPTQVANDIWYDYTATCTGTATASTCGADFNTRLVVYNGASCTAPILACNDDSCGTASEVSWSATAGSIYRIRLGSSSGTGIGTLVLSCTGAVCDEDLNGDTTVDVLDLLAVIGAWGGGAGPADINNDGVVDVLDLLALLAGWGPC